MRRFPCPFCGELNNAATAVDDNLEPPKAGDVSICVSCAELSLFTGESLTARKPTRRELDDLMADADIRRIVHASRLLLSREAKQ